MFAVTHALEGKSRATAARLAGWGAKRRLTRWDATTLNQQQPTRLSNISF
jgi:hypothetical protein